MFSDSRGFLKSPRIGPLVLIIFLFLDADRTKLPPRDKPMDFRETETLFSLNRPGLARLTTTAQIPDRVLPDLTHTPTRHNLPGHLHAVLPDNLAFAPS
jgi:hypothetical protein